MKKPHVLISYRFKRRDTTGIHCHSALFDLIGKDHVQFIDPDRFMMTFDRPVVDLYLAIDDDGEWIFPEDWTNAPHAIWFVDTHTNYAKRLKRAPFFDHVFAAQLRGTRRLIGDGIHAAWLPLACNPDMHYRVEAEKRFDWCFVGNAPRDRWLPTNRVDLLDLLKARWPNCFVGNAYFEDMMGIYAASRVVFNRSIIDDLNMRVFEVAASGMPLITNHVEGQDRLFDYDRHLYVYGLQDIPEATSLMNIVGWLLEDAPLRPKTIRNTGLASHEWAYRYHTYKARMRELLCRTIGYGSMDGLLDYDRDAGPPSEDDIPQVEVNP